MGQGIVNNSNATPRISDVIRQVRAEWPRLQVENGQTSQDGMPTSHVPPPPATLHVTAFSSDHAEAFAALEARARSKTNVNRLIPKFLRRLFRRQGSFNEEMLGLAKFLTREQLESRKRLGEIVAYLRAENGWFTNLMQSFHQLDQTLANRLNNQHSLAERLLSQDDKLGHVKAEILRRQQELAEQVERLSSALAQQTADNAEAATAREALEARVLAHQAELSRSNEVCETLARRAEAVEKADTELKQRLDATNQAKDRLSAALDAIRNALAAEVQARERLGDHLEAERLAARERLDELRRQVNATRQALGALEERQVNELGYIKREVQLYSRALVSVPTPPPASGPQEAQSQPALPQEMASQQFDNFYLSFENKFRGSRQTIKERLITYVPFIRKAGAGTKTRPVIDLGCGRGEWLELLRDEKLVGIGVDLNEFMIDECANRDLEVVRGDAIEHLSMVRAESIGAITAFHLIEHLPFAKMFRLFTECARVLRPGGLCIFETPNPDNIRIGSNYFYSDPTHLHPLPSAFTEFVVSFAGFSKVEVLPLHPNTDVVPLNDNPEPFDRFIHHLVFGAQDYAVIGRK